VRLKSLAVLIVSATVLAAGCGEGDPTRYVPPRGAALKGDFSGSGPGTLVSAETLAHLDPILRSKTSLAARITYVSTSGINDSHSLVSASVFVPNGAPPAGGWRVVALGHPGSGIDAGCAPSDSPTLSGSLAQVGALIRAGYLVTMTDYQGLGLRPTDQAPPGLVGPYNGYHPFLDSSTEAYNVIDSVRAAKKLVPVASDAFAVWGTGQGGQAAWAANEHAADYQGKLTLVGVVTAAPIAALDWLADAAAGSTLNREQQLLLLNFLAALKSEYPDFDLDSYRRGAVKHKWDALTSCRGVTAQDRSALIDAIGPDDLRPASAEAADALRNYLQKTSLPQAPAAAPMLVAADPDGVIPQSETDAAVRSACAMGDVIQLGGPPAGEPAPVIQWITDRFDRVPAVNDCGSVLVPEGSVPAPEPAGPAEPTG
jgi:hypothetical protein